MGNIAQSNINARIFVTNALDKRYFAVPNTSITNGFVSNYLAEPRMYGMRLRYSF